MNKFIVLTLLLALSYLIGCNGADQPAAGSGLIEADETLVSSETGGRVLKRFFDEGDLIAAGDTLAIVDPSHIESQLVAAYAGRSVLESKLGTARVAIAQAEAAQRFATNEFERVEHLIRSGSSTQRQFDQAAFAKENAGLNKQAAEAQLASLRAELVKTDADIAVLERLLADCFPICPSAGIVTESFIDPGELLAPGKPICKLARLDTVWVKLYLPAAHFANLTLGTAAQVSTESGGTTYQGSVIWTSQEAEFTPKNVQTEQSRADLVYAVKVRIANTDNKLKIGMPVFVTLDI